MKRPRRKRSEIYLPDGRKVCARCSEAKPLGDFPSDGRGSYCRECYAANARERRAANIDAARQADRARRERTTEQRRKANQKYARTDKAKAKAAAWLRANPDRKAAYNAVQRARRKGLVVDLGGTCQAKGCRRRAVHRHHESYDPGRRLDVVPLCAEHHTEVHARGALALKSGGRAVAPSPRSVGPRTEEARS